MLKVSLAVIARALLQMQSNCASKNAGISTKIKSFELSIDCG